jgi:hypothetical protein
MNKAWVFILTGQSMFILSIHTTKRTWALHILFCISCTTYSLYLFFRSNVWLPSLRSGARLLGKDKKIIDRVVAKTSQTDFTINQLVERSVLNPARRSLCRRPVGSTARCSLTSHSSYSWLGLHCQLHCVLASCAEDSLGGRIATSSLRSD